MHFKRLDRSSIFVIRIYEKSNGAIIFYKEESKIKGNFKKGVAVVLSLAMLLDKLPTRANKGVWSKPKKVKFK